MDQPATLPTPEAPPARLSLMGRLFNVFATPGEVFDDVRNSPPTASNWLVPALILMVLGWLSVALIFSVPSINYQIREMTDKAIQKQVEKQHMSEAQAEQARQAGEKYGAIGIKISSVLMPVFVAWFTPFWWGFILWMVGKFALNADLPYLKWVEAAGLTNMVLVLDTVVRSLLIILTSNLFAALSPVLLIKNYDQENTMHGFLALLNVMVFWALALRASALARLSGCSFLKAALWVFGIWAFYTGLMFGAGVAMRMTFAKMQG